jgi:hypothetical protein
MVAEFPSGLYLAGNPLLDLCFNPADSPGPKRHWPWEFPFGDTLINGRPVRSNTIGSLRIFLGIPFSSFVELRLNYVRIYQAHRAMYRQNCLQVSADNFDSLALFV